MPLIAARLWQLPRSPDLVNDFNRSFGQTERLLRAGRHLPVTALGQTTLKGKRTIRPFSLLVSVCQRLIKVFTSDPFLLNNRARALVSSRWSSVFFLLRLWILYGRNLYWFALGPWNRNTHDSAEVFSRGIKGTVFLKCCEDRLILR